jgi:hypothetical protein
LLERRLERHERRVRALRRAASEARRTALRRADRLDVRISRTPRPDRVSGAGELRRLAEQRRVWRERADRLGRRLAAPAVPADVRAALMCIHAHEGAWDANTGNGYHGGLQMDVAFQQAYGPEYVALYGTADAWPVEAQLVAGARAVAAVGYSPWPNTAAACGLG